MLQQQQHGTYAGGRDTAQVYQAASVLVRVACRVSGGE
jgi:hypothetical protein